MTRELALYLDLQQVVEAETIPDKDKIESWVHCALMMVADTAKEKTEAELQAELTIRIVDKEEIQALNRDYRQQDSATNVLSFPYEGFPLESPLEMQIPLLGDLLICHDIVVQEAQQQQKSITDHWAHMVVHGVLHLKGYDHIEDADAEIMEALEVQILHKLGIADPYL